MSNHYYPTQNEIGSRSETTPTNTNPSTSRTRHDKIIQFKRLLSSDPIDWEQFLLLEKELKAVTTPSLKCSFSWIMSKYPPNHVLRELLIRYQKYLFSSKSKPWNWNSIATTTNTTTNTNNSNNTICKECIESALKHRNVEFIRFIACKEKELLSQPLDDAKNYDLPLHRAGNLEIASILVQANPQSINVRNKNGDLPIHVAMKNYRHVDHIKFLIVEGKKRSMKNGGLLIKNKIGQTPFSILCKQIETGFDAVNLTLPFYSEDLRLWEKLNLILKVLYLDNETNSVSSNNVNSSSTFQILHESISSGCPHQAILMALIIKPEQISQMDTLGRYPLSLCANQTSCPKSTLLKLLKSYPHAAYIPDHNGRLCLHWAAMSERKLEDGTQDLLTAYPGGLNVADKDGMLPFMLAAASNNKKNTNNTSGNGNSNNGNNQSSLDLIYHLLRECPEYFSSIGKHGVV